MTEKVTAVEAEETIEADSMATEADLAATEAAVSRIKKCTKQHAQIAEKSAKYHSNLRREDRFIAEIATETIKHSKDGRLQSFKALQILQEKILRG